MNSPLVSIIMPCYNGEKYIHKLLESILDQDYKSIEFIAINDGSTDRTQAILESYKSKFKSRNIKYTIVYQENGGAPNAVNAGLRRFTGEYLNFVDCDDYFMDDAIKTMVNFLEEHQEIDVVWGASNLIDGISGEILEVWGEVNQPPRKNLFIDMILHRDYIWPNAAKLVRASTFLAVNPERHITEFGPGQNIQLFLPIYYKGNNIGYIDKPLAYITAHNDSDSRKYRSEEETIEYHNLVRDTFIDTLRKINMPTSERDKYISVVNERYQQYQQSNRIFYKINNGDELGRLYEYDKQRFRNNYTSDINAADQTQLAAKLVFSSHSIEKSLSNDSFEVGHGLRVSQLLINILHTYKVKKYNQDHLAYMNTLSVLRAYYERHVDTKYAGEIKAIFGDMLEEILASNSRIGGAEVIPYKQKKHNNTKNFKELAEGRFAVRTYSNTIVDKSDIKEVIEIAMKTPTVCNRQSIKIHTIYKKEIIKKVLDVQGGIAYYDTPPVLLLITSDDRGYVGPNERNQGYIDGGLFAMSVLYALEYKKLAACPLHAMFDDVQDMTIRGMLNLLDSEKLITFISVGHFNEKNNVCKSFRYPVDYVMSEISRIYDFRIETLAESQSAPRIHVKIIDRIRVKLRPRTRILNMLRHIKHKTRLRTRAKHVIASLSNNLDNQKYKHVDGAILTLTGYFNYGNVLQRYALQKFLHRKGFKFVSYVDPYSAPRDIYRIGRKIKLKTPLRAINRFIDNQTPYWYIPKYSELFPESYSFENIINFVNKNIWIKPFDPKDTYKNYIVGSDQVWRNWWDNKEILGYYFLDFIKDREANRIAYAASFGKDKISEVMSSEDLEYVRPLLNGFNKISVREQSGFEIIKNNWGIEKAEVTVDPTLLLEANDYSWLINHSNIRSQKIQPIFTYIIDETEGVSEFIHKVQDDRLQEATKIRAHVGAENDILPPVELWLKGFRDAEIVITNSFHGMLFSIINNTDFIIIGRETGGLSRIKSFLSEYGIDSRFVNETELSIFDIKKLKPVDWNSVNKKLEKHRKDSGDWLISAIIKYKS